ncbi:MAG: adenylate kinase [Erysipelothrix sp.]|nr:adenylate kinase [Erysipelothrix sp.]
MNILIMGVAGAGKGTMAERIKEHYNIPHISSGEMFREAIRQETPLGKLAKQYIDHGLLVPDDVTITMVKERLAKPDCTNGYLLDGFPRTMIQTGAFEKAMDDLDKKLDIVINLNVDFEVLEERITGRRLCKDCGAIYNIHNHKPKIEGVCDICGGELYQRSDDTTNQLRIRLTEYEHLTKPVIDFYIGKGDVIQIDASQPVEDVWNDLKKALEALNG